jgi:hypothetical protein
MIEGASLPEKGMPKRKGKILRNRWNKMTTIDLIVRKLEENPLKEEKATLMEDFRQQLQRYESGDLQDFKNTAIYWCYKHSYDFYV